MAWLAYIFENPFLWEMIWAVVLTKAIQLFLVPEMSPRAQRFAPSARSAAMASVTLRVGMEFRWDYPFVIQLLIAIVVCSDAIHRRQLGSQVAQFNRLVQELKKQDVIYDLPQNELSEDAGCSPTQIIMGIVVGVIVTLAWRIFR